ncbi:hypothetical protein EUX98_g9219 [Antrodiella citrinella]|uniref:Uncharacterized protein n=1 Tax=Antrodiella citrinella TaxID=2447956 RepID=A0A4S4LXS4_9APHY|nr:hypothetical protein EUX98_g9219 [Antrodiella citrinella]
MLISASVQSGAYSSQIRSLLPNAQWGIMRLLAYRYHQVREILNLDWPISSYTSKMYHMARIEGHYLHKVMEAVKKEMKSRTRAPNTRLTVLDAWMFFEILTKNNLEELETVLRKNTFSNQTVILEDMEELDTYLHRGEIADPTWWHTMDTRTAEERWENMTTAGWVTGNQPAKHDDAAWRSVPPLQQGLHSTRDMDKDGTKFTYAFGPNLSHVVRQYRDTVLIQAQPSNADASGSQQDFNKEPPKTRRKRHDSNKSDDNDNEEQEEQIQGHGKGKQPAGLKYHAMQVARELFPEVSNGTCSNDRINMHSNNNNGVHDTKGKGKTVDKGDMESGDEDKNKDKDLDEGEDEEAEIQPDIVTESRPKNARPRAPTVTSPRAGEKKKRARQMTPVKQSVIPAAVAKEVPQDKEMEDGEIPPSPVMSYVRPHTPISLKEWDDSLTQMLMSQKITPRDSRATQDKPR